MAINYTIIIKIQCTFILYIIRTQPKGINEHRRIGIGIGIAIHGDGIEDTAGDDIGIDESSQIRAVVAGTHVVQAVGFGHDTVSAVIEERRCGGAGAACHLTVGIIFEGIGDQTGCIGQGNGTAPIVEVIGAVHRAYFFTDQAQTVDILGYFIAEALHQQLTQPGMGVIGIGGFHRIPHCPDPKILRIISICMTARRKQTVCRVVNEGAIFSIYIYTQHIAVGIVGDRRFIAEDQPVIGVIQAAAVFRVNGDIARRIVGEDLFLGSPLILVADDSLRYSGELIISITDFPVFSKVYLVH